MDAAVAASMSPEPSRPPEPKPEKILATLAAHGVDFVVIGGLAAVAHGSRRMTRDIDIVVMHDAENLARLEAALGELDAVQLLPNAAEAPITPADVAMVALGTTSIPDPQRAGWTSSERATGATMISSDRPKCAITNPGSTSTCRYPGRGYGPQPISSLRLPIASGSSKPSRRCHRGDSALPHRGSRSAE